MPDIPINDVARRVQFTSSGSAGPYAFTFAVLSQDDVAVYSGATLKTLTTHYTVSLNANGTGSITYTSGNIPASGVIVTVTSDQAIARTSDYTSGGDFKAQTINDDLDKLTINQQQAAEVFNRTLTVPITDPVAVNMVLPAKADRLGKVLSFHSTSGDSVASQELGEFEGDWATGTAYVLRDIVKDTTNNNIYICITAHTSSGVNLSASDSANWSLLVDAASATTSQTAAAASAQLADDYAVKVNGAVTGTDFSAKAWSVGGTDVSTTASRGAAKEWATTTGATVDTSEYSAKEYALGTTVPAGSAKDWAIQAEDSAVTGSSYSALHHAAKSAASATAAANSQTAAASSQTAASASQVAAAASATAAAASADAFDDTYLGAKSSDPSVDNDGDALTAGDLFFSTSTNVMKVYTGSAWITAAVSSAGVVEQTGATGSGQIPTGTTAQRDGSPAVGYFRYNSTTNEFEGYAGSSPAWGSIGGGAAYFIGSGAATGDTTDGLSDIFRCNATAVATTSVVPDNVNCSASGPITVNSGVTLTVGSGSTMVIL